MISSFSSSRRSVTMIAGLALGFGIVHAADETAAVELGTNWKVGQRLSYGITTTQNQKITVAVNPQPMEQLMRQKQSFSVTVDKERDGGGHELAVEFTDLTMESSMNGNTLLKFDSKADPKEDAGNPAAAMMRPLANAKFRVLTRPNGKVDAVQGLKEVVAKAAGGANPLVAGMMESMVSEDAVKQMGIVPNWFPGKPVKPGDQWPVRFDLAMGPLGKINVAQTMTLKGWEEKQGRKCVLIESKGFLSSSPSSGASTNMFSITSLSGDTKGRLWFDPELGALVESDNDQNMRMKLKAMGQEISTQVVQSVTNALTAVTPAK